MSGFDIRWRFVHAMAALAFGAALATSMHANAQSRKICLIAPQFSEKLADACTQIIEAPDASSLERALALNNRAMLASGETAKRDFDEAIRLAPKVAKILHNRGLHLMIDQPERALQDFDAAILLDPRYAVAWTSRGETYAQMKQYDRAIADFDQAIRLAPGFMHPMYNPYEDRARAKEAKGDQKGAEADRKAFLPLWMRASAGKIDVRGPNARGARAWEPLIAISDLAKGWTGPSR